MFNPDPDNTTKIVDAAIKGVQVLADKLGVASGQLWDVLVTQGWFNLAKDVTALALILIVIWLMFKISRPFYMEKNYSGDSELGPFILVPSFVSFFLFVMFIVVFCDLQTPQMYAVSQILKAISK